MKKALFGLALLAMATPALAVDIQFSFTNTIGDVPGTVTGEIDGLVDNSTSAATAIWVNSYPAGLNSVFPAGPINVLLWTGGVLNNNAFTLTNGALTGVDFFITSNDAHGFNQLYLNSSCCGGSGTNFLNIDGQDGLYVWSNGPLNGRDGLTTGTSPAPEPASWAMMLGGFGLIGGALRSRRRATVVFA